MKQFHYLPFTVVQMAAVIVSMVVIVFVRKPSSSGRSGDGGYQRIDNIEGSEGGDETDPSDVSIPLQFQEGMPIDEDGFLAKMRLHLFAQAALAAILLTLDGMLAWFMDANDSYPQIFHLVASFLFSFYILGLSIWPIKQVKVHVHQTSVNHRCCLVALATALSATRLLLPELRTSVPKAPLIRIFAYSSPVLNLSLLAIVSLTNRAPELHFPPHRIYPAKTLSSSARTISNNVSGYVRGSILSVLLFGYAYPVVKLGSNAGSLETRDLPIVPADLRATPIFTAMRRVYNAITLPRMLQSNAGTEWDLLYKLFRVNWWIVMRLAGLKVVSAFLRYVPMYFMQGLVRSLEISDVGENPDASLVWFYCVGLFVSTALHSSLYEQIGSLSTAVLQARLRVQLNTMLFAKTLVRKDIASSAAPTTAPSSPVPATLSTTTPSTTAPSSPTAQTVPLLAECHSFPIEEAAPEIKEEEDIFVKAQVLTLMTTDVDRVGEFVEGAFTLLDASMEIISGTFFMYRLLGVSCVFGLAASFLCSLVNNCAFKKAIKLEGDLLKSRGARVSLINEILGGIRILKLMASERLLERRVSAIREKELDYQRKKYRLEVVFQVTWELSASLLAVVSFSHFAVLKGMPLTPSIAFPSLNIFNELKFPLTTLPETLGTMLQRLNSVRRIVNYLRLPEVTTVPPLRNQAELDITLTKAIISWPRSGEMSASAPPSAALTPGREFTLDLDDLTLEFPKGALSLICGKTGSGKTLLLLSLLGEADVRSGQITCPRSPPDVLAKSAALDRISAEDWVVRGVCAYVPQTAWLRNASIRENILFNLPFDEERYNRTLEACALPSDIEILADGDSTEIGEGAVNLSGGQKARVSLARAIYSRASVLFIDDVLSAVDPWTARHIFESALTGPLARGRTVILASHHVDLCAEGAAYIVELDNGRTTYAGSRKGFPRHGVMQSPAQSTDPGSKNSKETVSSPVEEATEETHDKRVKSENSLDSEISSTAADTSTAADSQTLQPPRQPSEEETSPTGLNSLDVWAAYVKASGGKLYWAITIVVLFCVASTPVASSDWLRYWLSMTEHGQVGKGPLFYLGVYAALNAAGIFAVAVRGFLHYRGSIRASTVLHKRLLKAVLFASIPTHDTTKRGHLLNCFGKNFETIDSSLANKLREAVQYSLAAITTLIIIIYVGGLKSFIAVFVIGALYYICLNISGKSSHHTARLGSVTRSPLYAIYRESIAGVAVLRAFGAGSLFLREMHQHVDTNTNAYYWMCGVNQWLSIWSRLISAVFIGAIALIVIIDKQINASFAGFVLTFANTLTVDLLFMNRKWVDLVQSMTSLELVEELQGLPQESPEYIEPRPAASWPHEGAIEVKDLVVQYAPDQRNVLDGLNFIIEPRSKIGVLGPTGAGKSTLALSFFRFVEATAGMIVIDGVDISKIGLTDLRSRLTIIPQDPTILSGTLRSTLDIFGEFGDCEIYDVLRVLLTRTAGTSGGKPTTVNANRFRNLDSPVAEGGENYSSGERQLICMARAILKRPNILLMDEATASIDYATDELIGKTIRDQFSDSTVITIAHRPRTVIDYDQIMFLERGRISEFDHPDVLLANPNSKVYNMCKSLGDAELADLQRMAYEAAAKRKSRIASTRTP